MNAIVPDYMTALVAYRAWNLTPEGDLLSHNQMTSEPWPAKTKKLAICTQLKDEAWGGSQLLSGGLHYLTTSLCMPPVVHSAHMNFAAWWNRKMVQKANANHHAPERDCSCGIYAAKSNKSSHFHSYQIEMPVWGEVYLWGKIQEYTDGYRAEFAYPKALSTSNERLADRVTERYGVPCKYVHAEKPKRQRIGGITISLLANSGWISAGLQASTNANYGAASTQATPIVNSQSTSCFVQPYEWKKFFGVE